jgi:tetraacyldisaccharide 4'-kinase
MNPLSGLYGTVTALRNTLFDRGVLVSRHLQRPVISVGNLSVGGSGKTPFVIALGELLKQRDIRFNVLTRGYGRKTRGVLVVDFQGNASSFGDEPLLIARRLGVPIIVGESRYQAGRMAEEKFDTQLHILDDGFQHRSLARDFDIVLLSEQDLEDKLLPCGRLREPLSSLHRADAIVIPHGLSLEANQWKLKFKDRKAGETLVYSMKREFTVPTVPRAPIVFCGIARPRQFFEAARAAGITPAAELRFRDHHAYTEADVQRLLAKRAELNAGGFLTTEKDAINLGAWQRHLEPLAIASLSLTIDRFDDMIAAILARIANRDPRS